MALEREHTQFSILVISFVVQFALLNFELLDVGIGIRHWLFVYFYILLPRYAQHNNNNNVPSPMSSLISGRAKNEIGKIGVAQNNRRRDIVCERVRRCAYLRVYTAVFVWLCVCAFALQRNVIYFIFVLFHARSVVCRSFALPSMLPSTSSTLCMRAANAIYIYSISIY